MTIEADLEQARKRIAELERQLSEPGYVDALRSAREQIKAHGLESAQSVYEIARAALSPTPAGEREPLSPMLVARIWPCAHCGVMRSEAEGGKAFVLCDGCWKRSAPPEREASKP